MAVKGMITLFAVKKYWHKNFKGKKGLCKNSLEISFQSGSKAPCFTRIETSS
jgi:hypothetical protein